MRFIFLEFSSKQRLNYEDVASSVMQSKLSRFNCKFEQQSPLITPELKFSRSSEVAEEERFAARTQREQLDAVLSHLLCCCTSKTTQLYHYCQYSARKWCDVIKYKSI
jgi:hypothetical protein